MASTWVILMWTTGELSLGGITMAGSNQAKVSRNDFSGVGRIHHMGNLPNTPLGKGKNRTMRIQTTPM
jgi:hypothetical protein